MCNQNSDALLMPIKLWETNLDYLEYTLPGLMNFYKYLAHIITQKNLKKMIDAYLDFHRRTTVTNYDTNCFYFHLELVLITCKQTFKASKER